jgi:hypothetical protein
MNFAGFYHRTSQEPSRDWNPFPVILVSFVRETYYGDGRLSARFGTRYLSMPIRTRPARAIPRAKRLASPRIEGVREFLRKASPPTWRGRRGSSRAADDVVRCNRASRAS